MFSIKPEEVYNPYSKAGLSGRTIELLKFNLCNLYVLEATNHEERLLTILDILSHHLIEYNIDYLVDLEDGVNYFRVKPYGLNSEHYIKSTNNSLVLVRQNSGALNVNNIGIYIAHYIYGRHCKFCVL